MRVRRSRRTRRVSRSARRRRGSNQTPGFGSLSASPSAQRARLRDRRQARAPRRIGEALQRCRNARRLGASPPDRGSRVQRGSSASSGSRRVEQALQHLDAELVATGRAKADRRGDALAVGDAVVAPARRQVQHVAGLEQPLVARRRSRRASSAARRRAARAPRDAADAPAPAPVRSAAGRRRSESTCGPTPPPSLAYENITSSSRASGTKRKRRAADAPRRACRSTPCTSSVQRGALQRRQRAPRERPVAQRPARRRRARPGATRRRRGGQREQLGARRRRGVRIGHRARGPAAASSASAGA